MIPWVEANYRTLGDSHRAIAGLSMGGFGAMKYAARHPGLFAAAASFSGAVDMMWGFPVNGIAFLALHERFGTPDDRVWGNQVTNMDEWRANNPADLAASLEGTALFIATGQGLPAGAHDDPTRFVGKPDSLGGFALEHGIWQMNVSFVAHLDLAGVYHTDWFYTGGDHSWPYWQDDLHWALPQIMDVIE
jgi:S-formylglutathione hydrolase FrmB